MAEVQSRKFYKNSPDDTVWWVDNDEETGTFEFSFDKEKVFNLFKDYPWKLSQEQKQIFDTENPDWAEFFGDRKE